jgi:ketol-acid reductoisomerase
MQEILENVRNGTFAKEFILENQSGRASMNAYRRREAALQIEEVGKGLRDMMSWMKKKGVAN